MRVHQVTQQSAKKAVWYTSVSIIGAPLAPFQPIVAYKLLNLFIPNSYNYVVWQIFTASQTKLERNSSD